VIAPSTFVLSSLLLGVVPAAAPTFSYEGALCGNRGDVDRFVSINALQPPTTTIGEVNDLVQKAGVDCKIMIVKGAELPAPIESFTYRGKDYELRSITADKTYLFLQMKLEE
jgi:hypothetical protein